MFQECHMCFNSDPTAPSNVCAHREMGEESEIVRINEDLKDFSSIGPLENIVILNLHSNSLSSLQNLTKSVTLTDLNLSSNQFENAPDLMNLSQLINLKTLDLSGNSINSLDSFPYHPSIEHFSIAFNQFQTLDGINCFPSLKSLDIRGNLLSTVLGFSALETLSALESLDISSPDGRHANPICQFEGDVLRIFDFSYFGLIDGKSRQEWVTMLKPLAQLRSRERVPAQTNNTPRLDAMLEKFRRGALPGSSGGLGIDDIYDDDNSLPITDSDLNFSRGQMIKRAEESLDNPWNFTVGVRSNLVRRGDIVKRLSVPQRKESKDDMSELSGELTHEDDLSERGIQLDEGDGHSEVKSERKKIETLREKDQELESQRQQFDYVHKNILQLTVAILKVMNRLQSQKVVVVYWNHWKGCVAEENSQQMRVELLQENDLLRATNKLTINRNEELLLQQNEMFKKEKNKMEIEFHEKAFLSEKILSSQRKEYAQLKALYQNLEKHHENEIAEVERKLVHQRQELNLQIEMEKNEMILLMEEKSRQLNETKRQIIEMEERESSLKAKHENEKKELESWWEKEKESYERLIELHKEEKRMSDREWNEKFEQERKRRTEEFEVNLTALRGEMRSEREELIQKHLEERQEYISSVQRQERENGIVKKANSHLKKELMEVNQKLSEMTERYEESSDNIRELREMLFKITTRCKELEKLNHRKKKESETHSEGGLPPPTATAAAAAAAAAAGGGGRSGGGRAGGGGDKDQIEELLGKVKYWEEVSQDLQSQHTELLLRYENLKNMKVQDEKDLKLTIQIKDHMLDNQNVIIENLKEKQKAEEGRYHEFMEQMEQTHQRLQRKFQETEEDLQNEIEERKGKYKNKIKELEENHEQQIEEYSNEITRLRGLLEDKDQSIRYLSFPLLCCLLHLLLLLPCSLLCPH
jgi:hypothetical protein